MNQHPMWPTIVAGIGVSVTVFVVLIVYPVLNQPLATLAALMATAVAVATSVRRQPPTSPGSEACRSGRRRTVQHASRERSVTREWLSGGLTTVGRFTEEQRRG
jgi:hypothetical protein